METKIAEIADGIFRLSTYVPQIAPPAGFAFNSFLVRGEQPLLFHTGLHKMFPLNRKRSPRSSRSRACAGSRSATMRPTSAAR